MAVTKVSVHATVPEDLRVWLEEISRDGPSISKLVTRALIEMRARMEQKEGKRK